MGSEKKEQNIDRALSNVDQIKAEHYARREEKAKKATTSKKADDMKAAFVRAYLLGEFDQRVIPPIGKETWEFRRHWNMYAGDLDIAEFLELVCLRWEDIRMGGMSWHSKFPSYPDFGFIGRHLRFFLQAIRELDRHINQTDTLGKRVREKRNWKDVKGEH